MTTVKPNWFLKVQIIVMLLSLMLSGCSQSRALSPPPPPPTTGSFSSPPTTTPTTPGSVGTGQTSTPVTTSAYPIAPLFYDFEDIPIPQEMDMITDESRVFMVGQFKSGVLVFKGRVEANSLVDFFQAAMVREKWQFKSGFRYNRSVLVFEKPQKTCVVVVYSRLIYTYLEIYVAPTQARF
ncbi:MAG: hypothetical protein N2260_07395 [Syntrophobacterales bacterium]|nr:hypothetical protein [Syntrophobacterales bacterium]